MTVELTSRTLVGREAECERLDELLVRARNGRSGCLILLGDPGIGKTALLQYAVGRAGAMTVVTAHGIESESELPYSGLLELLRPLLDRFDTLPDRQAGALASALAIGPATRADPFAVAAATLTLLAEAASHRPLLVVVDDLQWVDAASAGAILFALRRLGAEPAAGILAARTDPATNFEGLGIPVLRLNGLDRQASLALLAAGAHGPIPGEMIERLLRETEGNPLALVELLRVVRPGQLSGTEPLDETPLPVGERIELAYAGRVAALPPDTRTGLLIAAACDAPALDLVARALTILGLSLDVMDAAERADLVELSGLRVVFRHPLVRSAVYYGEDAGRRRAIHAALAAALAGMPGETDGRRAWHLAAAALDPDETVARELDAAASAASRRSGYAAAARALERAAELSPAMEAGAVRLVEAARAWQLANRSDRAVEVLDKAAPLTRDLLLRAEIEHQRGRIDTWRGPALHAHERLCAEAERIVDIAPERAAAMLADATLAGITAGDLNRALAAARRGYELAQHLGGITELLAALQLGKVCILTGDAMTGHPLIMRCAEARNLADDDLEHMAEVVQSGPALLTVEAYELADGMLSRVVAAQREANALGLLSYSLGAMAELQARTGRWAESYANGAEASLLAREAGQAGQLSYNLARLARIEAARGLEDDCRAHVAEALDLAGRYTFGSTLPFAESALGLLELGLGRLPSAILHLEETERLWQRMGFRDPGRLEWEGDLVEAYIRSGLDREGMAALDTLELETHSFLRPVGPGTGSGSQCAIASAAGARCRGLLAPADRVDAVFAEALAWHDRTSTPFERARTELCYGEQLRRFGRRIDARTWLRSALETFDRLDAGPWAGRARTELAATGEKLGPRHPRAVEQLTPQELQVALIVSKGATNREAGAALFLTPKTIEFHLAKIYRKLDLRSRTELAGWAAGHLPAERADRAWHESNVR